MHVTEEMDEEGEIIDDNLAAMSRLAGNDYVEIGEKTTIKRPD